MDENGGVTVESHLLDVCEQLYGKACRVEFVQRLRYEQKFPDLTALQTQIAKDIATARAVLAKVATKDET